MPQHNSTPKPKPRGHPTPAPVPSISVQAPTLTSNPNTSELSASTTSPIFTPIITILTTSFSVNAATPSTPTRSIPPYSSPPSSLSSSPAMNSPPGTLHPPIDNTAQLPCYTCRAIPPKIHPCPICTCTHYCSLPCLTTHHPAHAIACISLRLAQDPTVLMSGPLHGLHGRWDGMFGKLIAKTIFHDMDKRDVVGLLVDSYRLSRFDEMWPYPFESAEAARNHAARFPLPELESHTRVFFLTLTVVAPTGMLPAWWSFQTVGRVMDLAMRADKWHFVGRGVTPRDIARYYGHPLVPVFLRVLFTVMMGREGEIVEVGRMIADMEGGEMVRKWVVQRNDLLGGF